MFRGHSYRNMDSKGRLMLPPEFRDHIVATNTEGRFMLTNFDGCVVGYTLPEWEAIEHSFYEANNSSKKIRSFQRFFIGGAIEVQLDKQGRILVPPYLRQYADLERDVVLAGVGRKFEIWSQAHFEAQRQEVEEDFDSVMDELAANGMGMRL